MIKVEKNLAKNFGIKVEYIILEGIKIEKSSQEFINYREKIFEGIRKKYRLETLKDNDIIKAYRKFFWKINIDPTKIRPSSEALIRRILSKKEIPLINNLVDTYNLASAITLICMGAYDLDKIKGTIEIRRSINERFIGIGGKEIITKDHIVVADDEKIISIYPYRDSEETKITDTTRNAIVLLCGVNGISIEYLTNAKKKTMDLFKRFLPFNHIYNNI